MRLKFDSESGVFTIKPESEAEITKPSNQQGA